MKLGNEAAAGRADASKSLVKRRFTAVDFGAQVSLVPDSGIQFLDFEISADDLNAFRRRFLQETVATEFGIDVHGGAGGGTSAPDGQLILHAIRMEDGVLRHPVTQQPLRDDETMTVKGKEALQPFLDAWLPVPFMRILGREAGGDLQLDDGPANWARVHISAGDPAGSRGAVAPGAGGMRKSAAGSDGEPASYHVVLAIDTNLAAEQAGDGGDASEYLAPNSTDVSLTSRFAFSHKADDVAWFVDEPWVDDWVQCQFLKAQGIDEGPLTARQKSKYGLDHIAHYLALLGALGELCRLPQLRFIDRAVSQKHAEPVAVDLVLDVGNSRSFGMLMEQHDDLGPQDLQRAHVLGLRDLSRPANVYESVFDSHVEFVPPYFGDQALSRRSGRRDAFSWPSFARVGPEAARFGALADQGLGATGISSPKRYLWDCEPLEGGWCFAGGASQSALATARVSGPLLQYLSEEGDVLSRKALAPPAPTPSAGKGDSGSRSQRDGDVGADPGADAGSGTSPSARADSDADSDAAGTRPAAGLPAVRPKFSRSSLLSFFLCEVLLQAITQMNSPYARLQQPRSNAIRQLRRIVVTAPVGMPPEETRLMQMRLDGAVDLVWQALGWAASQPGAGATGAKSSGDTSDKSDKSDKSANPGTTYDAASAASAANAPSTPTSVPPRPVVELGLDEATAPQMVYLYDQLARKFSGTVEEFIALKGKVRGETGVKPALRVASIDIGAGATGLSVVTYTSATSAAGGSNRLTPNQQLRVGVHMGGDDVIQAVVLKHVIPAIEAALRAKGHKRAQDFLRGILSDKALAQREEQVILRKRLVGEVLGPLAQALLEDYQRRGELPGNDKADLTIGGWLKADGRGAEAPLRDGSLREGAAGAPAVVADFDDLVAAEGLADFRLLDTRLSYRPGEISETIGDELGGVLADLSDISGAMDCDICVVSGRTSHLPDVLDLLLERMPVRPDRIVMMHDYQPGGWYPMRDKAGCIADAKTVVATGALIHQLSGGKLDGFELSPMSSVSPSSSVSPTSSKSAMSKDADDAKDAARGTTQSAQADRDAAKAMQRFVGRIDSNGQLSQVESADLFTGRRSLGDGLSARHLDPGSAGAAGSSGASGRLVVLEVNEDALFGGPIPGRADKDAAGGLPVPFARGAAADCANEDLGAGRDANDPKGRAEELQRRDGDKSRGDARDAKRDATADEPREHETVGETGDKTSDKSRDNTGGHWRDTGVIGPY